MNGGIEALPFTDSLLYIYYAISFNTLQRKKNGKKRKESQRAVILHKIIRHSTKYLLSL